MQPGGEPAATADQLAWIVARVLGTHRSGRPGVGQALGARLSQVGHPLDLGLGRAVAGLVAGLVVGVGGQRVLLRLEVLGELLVGDQARPPGSRCSSWPVCSFDDSLMGTSYPLRSAVDAARADAAGNGTVAPTRRSRPLR